MQDNPQMTLKGADEQIGKYIRYFRTLNGFTQVQLAEPMGITYQQLQKYERGANSI